MGPPSPTAASAPLLVLAYGAATAIVTYGGGALAIRLGGRVGVLVGATAGVVLGAALFDLLPQALTLAGPAAGNGVLTWMALGLGGYLLLDRLLGRLHETGRWRGHLAPATLTLRSLLDGIGIGISFQLSAALGGMIALAVIANDLMDGANIVTMCLALDRRGAARGWLAANSLAPLLGVVVGQHVHLSPHAFAAALALLAGVFVHIGASELVPRAHAFDPRLRTTLAALAGMALMLTVAVVAG